MFCDWYLELVKPMLRRRRGGQGRDARPAAWVLDQILKLLHPFMPFITEELWATGRARRQAREPAGLAPWPQLDGLADAEADEEIGWVIESRQRGPLGARRDERAGGAKMPLALPGARRAMRERAEQHEETISRLARLEGITFANAPPRARR